MRYYQTPARIYTGFYVIEVFVKSDFTAYIKSCTAKSVRYAYTKRTAKPFDSCEQASRYIEKNQLLKRFPLGCQICAVPAIGDSKKTA